MKCLLFFLLALFLTSHAFSQNATMATQPPRVQYNEDQHQYITREAFNLLQNQNGIAIPTFHSTLQSHLGTTEQRNIPFVGSKIVAGAYVSSTHFGEAGDGDDIRNDSGMVNLESRTLFVFVKGGFINFFDGGLGVQISNQYSVAFKYGAVFVNGGSGYFPPTSSATGICMSYHFNGRIFNSITTGFSLLIQSYPRISGFVKGTSADVIIAKDEPLGKGFNFIYGLGIGYSKTKVHAGFLFIPCLEIGTVFNI